MTMNRVHPRYIACIGSRETPADVLAWMEETGAALVNAGYGIISGNAPGADQAWARGANSVDPSKVALRLPWMGFEPGTLHMKNCVLSVSDLGADVLKRCQEIAKTQHKRWSVLGPPVQRLLARNVLIVEPATLVVGYVSPSKAGGGGTGHAFRVAKFLKTPTLNIADASVRKSLWVRLEIKKGPAE